VVEEVLAWTRGLQGHRESWFLQTTIYIDPQSKKKDHSWEVIIKYISVNGAGRETGMNLGLTGWEPGWEV
jgi:hypothetical protein